MLFQDFTHQKFEIVLERSTLSNSSILDLHLRRLLQEYCWKKKNCRHSLVRDRRTMPQISQEIQKKVRELVRFAKLHWDIRKLSSPSHLITSPAHLFLFAVSVRTSSSVSRREFVFIHVPHLQTWPWK